jgi:muramoyltetrapeptide carboxypeptidase
MIRPPFLKSGDKIGIVAPGRKVSALDIEIAVQQFRSWGLEVVMAPNLFSTDENYLAGTDSQRQGDYQSMLDNPDIRAIINARGGYGTTRILDHLDFTAFQSNPKWIVGFSDITALHLKLAKLGFQSIHGTMPIVFGKADAADSIHSLRRYLFGDVHDIRTAGNPLNRNGHASGDVVGGNLSLIVDSLGTSSEVDTAGKILIIEEIDEYLYRIDRMLVHLKRAGKLRNLAGLIVGHMTGPLDTELRFGHSITDMILEHVGLSQYPVVFDFPSGHENPNLSWAHGGRAELLVNNEHVTLSFDRPL